ncbi:mannose-1-phosphate guanylyltransferase, partial [Bacteriovoracaceae bacterium]|nr:mannose-1-phosphate guanylyltransferase [Bacteriovoracaceae bacterium]
MSQEKKIHIVILCGGSGTRLWPMSITEKPKQFLQIFNNESLFQQTIRRNLNLADKFTVVVNQKQLETCKEQVASFPEKKFNFIVESIGRNTAPAICLAALTLEENELFLVTPSDHYVEKIDLYEKNIYEAIQLNQNQNHVVFGITPLYAETGYGYIHANNQDVLGFKEKPNKETAEEYLKDQNYFWNSGMFLFHKNFFLQEISNYSDAILNACEKTLTKINVKNNQIDLPGNLMKEIPSDSIDYALMEKSKKIKISK